MNSDRNVNSNARRSIKESQENADGLYFGRTYLKMKICYRYLSKIPIFFSNKSKFLVRYITTCIVIGTYYTCKWQRNTKALELSFCKNASIRNFSQVYDLSF